jgi:hypothetical protein
MGIVLEWVYIRDNAFAITAPAVPLLYCSTIKPQFSFCTGQG